MADGILRDSAVLAAILDVLRRDRREGGRIIEKLVAQPTPQQGSVPGHSYPGEVALQHDWHWQTPERGVQVLDTTAHVIQSVMGLPTVELGTSRLRYLTTLQRSRGPAARPEQKHDETTPVIQSMLSKIQRLIFEKSLVLTSRKVRPAYRIYARPMFPRLSHGPRG
jgi:hypothetical protein